MIGQNQCCPTQTSDGAVVCRFRIQLVASRSMTCQTPQRHFHICLMICCNVFEGLSFDSFRLLRLFGHDVAFVCVFHTWLKHANQHPKSNPERLMINNLQLLNISWCLFDRATPTKQKPTVENQLHLGLV